MENFNLHNGNLLRTFSGLHIDVFDPQPGQIAMIDIAHGLSNVCRFAGQCSQFYSVAQHSVYVADCIGGKEMFAALMHDATEAYIGDMPRPIKRMMPNYKEIELKLEKVIFERFGLEYPMKPELKALIKQWDNFALEAEHKALMLNDTEYFPCLKQEDAKKYFLEWVQSATGIKY